MFISTKIVSPVQNLILKNNDGNLILPHKDCRVMPLLVMSLSLVLILTSSICAKYKGGVLCHLFIDITSQYFRDG